MSKSFHLHTQNGLSGSLDISAIIAINTCTTSCPSSPLQQLGVVLFAGPYSPVQTELGYAAQNYTVKLPSSLPTGKDVLLTVAHFGLIGVGVSYRYLSWANRLTLLATGWTGS